MNNNSTFFFLKQLLTQPSKVGALLPSSSSLKNVIVELVREQFKNHEILEVGPGTGAFTFDLECLAFEKKAPFCVVEINKNFTEYLKTRLAPNTTLLNICTSELGSYKDLAKPYIVISSIPLKSLARQKAADIIRIFHQILEGSPESVIIQYSYGTQPPPLLDDMISLLKWEQVSFVIRNVPPATVWRLICKP